MTFATKINLKHKTRDELVSFLDDALKIIDKQNKMIDDMAETMSILEMGFDTLNEPYKKQWCEFLNSDEDCCWKTDKRCQDCIKEYFEKKTREVNRK